MKCPNCGCENDLDAEFCEQCGNALTQLCPKCNSPLKPGASFCKKCGAPVILETEQPGERVSLEKSPLIAKPNAGKKQPVSSLPGAGERKPVTILFADIVGSTPLAEKIDPEEWKEIVSGAHRRVMQAVHRYEGTIAQLLGDGVLAFFGAPLTHEDDPVRAVRAALDIQQEISRYAFELKGYIDNFQMRVGLNTGIVVVGNVGSEMHMEYLAIGDAVNLAARLQSAAQPGKILLSENTARLVKTAFELNPMGEITVKGKTEPLNAYEVIERKGATDSSRGFEQLESPLVGRANELAELNQALTELCEGHGQIVAVLGEAGIGKSRLVEEARCSTGDLQCKGKPRGQDSLHWLEGRALSYGATLSFWTISQLIKNDLGLSDADPEPRLRLALSRRVVELFGDRADQNMPYLARLLGVTLDDRLGDQINLLDSETLKRQTLICISRYFEMLANKQPTVAVFEDLHWIDPSSLEALELLLPITDRAPLMLLVLSRLEREQASWRIKLKAETDFSHRYTEIQLKPLSAGQQNQLVDNLLRIAELPEELRRLIHERAEGNPFYLEEIVRSLIEQGAIQREGDHWKATRDILNVTIPDTLQGVLLARLDRLQEDVRRTLQLAAVIGRSFLYSILDSISEAEQRLDEHLAQLQRVDLVREKNRLPELEYIFRHSLTQEAAYNSLLVARRVEFHRKVGEALEKLFPERLEEFYGILAHHFEAAGENEKAIEYLIRAGDKARLMYELAEAIGYYQRAVPILESTGDTNRLAQVWLKLGLVYNTSFRFEEAHQANEQAFSLQKQVASFRSPASTMKPSTLRICNRAQYVSLDPGIVDWEIDAKTVCNLFSGLVQIDRELNVVPDAARSWQVLDGGRRYLINLRDDVCWSDGSQVIAKDFEYAWKRNLKPELDASCAQFLFDVVGAQDYHEGRTSDPDSIGVHAVDNLTLEVFLVEPVAYFPFILSMPITYPLPKRIIDRFAGDWWKPEHMICNGPYRLVKFDSKNGSAWELNPYYYGQFTGNIQHVDWVFANENSEVASMYQENLVDLAFMGSQDIQGTLPRDEIHIYPSPKTNFIIFSTALKPLDDVRIRRALALAIDRDELHRKFAINTTTGGLVPPGIPGHSPDLGLRFDLSTAQQLLAEAGYPGGNGFPPITGIASLFMGKIGSEIARQWHDYLGIDATIEPKDPNQLVQLKGESAIFHLFITGWLPDYPDPDNALCQESTFMYVACFWGWHDDAYLKLVKEAGRTSNQVKRMEMYRQADRMIVEEQVLICPITYSGKQTCTLVKPWVKNLDITPLGKMIIKDIIVEEH